MKTVVETIFAWGPLIFAVGFLWPLFAQSIASLGATGHGVWLISGVIALVLGGLAQWRGRWI